MYVPNHFRVEDVEKTWAFIESNAFGQIISSAEGKLFSTHMPFLVDRNRSTLIGHFAKTNPHWIELDGQQVLVSLQGAHGYISPSWYKESGVPTWNYQAAHITGIARTFRDETQLKQLVDKLTEIYEAGSENPWLPPDYNSSMLKGIVGVEVEITDIQCKFKLNQNRSVEDREKVIEELEKKKGAHPLAQAMRDHSFD
jgi:transcriptional regulator